MHRSCRSTLGDENNYPFAQRRRDWSIPAFASDSARLALTQPGWSFYNSFSYGPPHASPAPPEITRAPARCAIPAARSMLAREASRSFCKAGRSTSRRQTTNSCSGCRSRSTAMGIPTDGTIEQRSREGQAGDLAPVDNMTQVICEDSGPKPCASVPSFIQHTTAGTRNGTVGGATFQFDWTPPAANAGPVTLYVAGNAANGNSNLT